MSLSDIQIIPYNHELKNEWDSFVDNSKNGTFLFRRDYMDYHADRFKDRSLLFLKKDRLYCLLPANIKENILISHAGLTYGGLIMSYKCTASGILSVFDALTLNLRSNNIKTMIYKPVPHIYHDIPAEEDLYAIFRNNGSLTVRNISSTLVLDNPMNFAKDRRAAARKALAYGITVERSDNFKSFWKVLEQNLIEKFNARPVHSIDEIEKLAWLFPENIQLFTASKDNRLLGGVVCYIIRDVVHTQYISANEEGKNHGAVDAIVTYLINHFSQDMKYLDFGTSCEDRGRYLNETLIYQKQGFGGRGICYDTYQISL